MTHQQAHASVAVTTPQPHWRFFRAGGFDQVRLETGAEILALGDLDQKLWVALACPAQGIEFDPKTLALLDTDNDGRIRAGEVLAAVAWLKTVLADPEELVSPGDRLSLAAISRTTPEGNRILACAKRILANIGKPDAQSIGPEDTADTARIFDQTDFNGDGVIPVSAGRDEATRAVIRDIIAIFGPEPDRSGQPGIDQPRVDAFAEQLELFAAWWLRAAADPAILPLGAETAAAAEALAAVRDKVDDYFLRCRLADYSPAAGEAMNPKPEAFQQLAWRPIEDCALEIDNLALARIAPAAELPLEAGLNPAWRARMAAFRDKVTVPLLGPQAVLTEADWVALCGRFAAYAAWHAEKPETIVEPLGAARIMEIRATGFKAELDQLLAEDKALEPEANAIDQVERLILFRRDIHRLVENFVNFREFYTRRGKATFQAGTLYLDGRSCDLCVRVQDLNRHSSLANLSRIYLVYCECVRKGSNETMLIAAAFTNGDSDQLRVGRNGVFYDRGGTDWDATIVKIVEHPISLRQAFWGPYRQLGRFVGEQIEKMAQAKTRTVHDNVTVVVQGPAATKPAAVPPAAPAATAPTVAAPGPGRPPDPPPFDVGRFAGVFAALGLAVGAIGTAIASVVTGFLHLVWWQMPLALIGLAAAVSGPSMVTAFMKLRQRNLAPILDATGWAVNARAKINIPFGTSLTQLARLPDGAERSLIDPFAERETPWRRWVVLALVVTLGLAGWWSGLISKLLTYL